MALEKTPTRFHVAIHTNAATTSHFGLMKPDNEAAIVKETPLATRNDRINHEVRPGLISRRLMRVFG